MVLLMPHEHPQYTNYQTVSELATDTANAIVTEALFTNIAEEEEEPIYVSKYVNKTDNESITGIKTFCNNININRENSPYLELQNSNFTLGNDPSSNRFWNINFADSKSNIIGDILYYHNADANNGDTCVEFRILSIDGVPVTDITTDINYTLGIRYDKSENIFYGFAPTPKESSNTNHIATTKWVINKLNSSYQSMPVGSIYVQYPNQSDPTTLFGGTWSNVSSSYAGRFFRAEGGSAAAFGSNQNDGLPNITGTIWTQSDLSPIRADSGGTSGCFYKDAYRGNRPDGGGGTGSYDIGFNAANSNSKYGSANEIRPINSTIRIWKRTK